MRAIVLLAMGAAAATAAAQAERHGEALRHEGVIAAPPAGVYAALTTAEGVQRAWGVARAKVDFRLGGSYRTVYDAKTDLGGPDAIVNTILAFEPDRMIAIRPSAPRSAEPFIHELCKTAWTVLRLEPLGADQTRFCIAMMGFGEGELAEQARRHFDRGNAWTLAKMQQALGDPRSETALAATRRARERLETLCGGEWTATLPAMDGAPLSACTRWTRRLEGRFLVAEGWLGPKDALHEHGHLLIGVDPASGALGYWHFGEHGDVTLGQVRAFGDDRFALDWNTAYPGGKRVSQFVQLVLEGDDAYRMVLHASEAAAATEPPLVDVRYTRAPAGGR